ncbi:MAG: hypothetical protein ACI9LY_004078 [Arenicella sp.]|jgi:hypothetical protein
MSFFSNTHVLVALIAAPILALLSYFMVDRIVKEEPKPALEGRAYRLVAKSNCRYTSGACDLVNASFKSTLVVEKTRDTSTLVLDSSHILDGVKIGFSDLTEDDSFSRPFDMQRLGDTGTRWKIEMPVAASETTRLMVVMLADGAHYYAATTMGFAEYRAAYKTDFRTSSPVTEKQQ